MIPLLLYLAQYIIVELVGCSLDLLGHLDPEDSTVSPQDPPLGACCWLLGQLFGLKMLILVWWSAAWGCDCHHHQGGVGQVLLVQLGEMLCNKGCGVVGKMNQGFVIPTVFQESCWGQSQMSLSLMVGQCLLNGIV
ncbi:hypothetical protein CHUAL_010740 [Chamberlinius hualienensis]